MKDYDFHVVYPSSLPVILTTVVLSNTLLLVNTIRQVSSRLRGVAVCNH